MPRSVRPWFQNEVCPEPGYVEFRRELMSTSYHNAAEGGGEAGRARTHLYEAARIAAEADWPYWAMERMFREIQPLVAWDSFMQAYINTLRAMQ